MNKSKAYLHFSKDRGRHYIAKCDIKSGELIMSDRGDFIPRLHYNHPIFIPLVNKLLSDSRYEVLHCNDIYTGVTSPDTNITDKNWQKAINILHTNCFSFDHTKDIIFPLISYFNHSCAPNALIDFGGSNVGLIYAYKNISKGEEITINYLENNITYINQAARQKRLNYWRFNCNCSLCTSQKEEEENFAKLNKYRKIWITIKPTVCLFPIFFCIFILLLFFVFFSEMIKHQF
jgi:SET domain-containing protein